MALISKISFLIFGFISIFSQDVFSSPLSNSSYAITGVEGFGVHPRLEIRDMQRNYPLQYNLYVLALKAFQAADQNDRVSYFQIAGIHGLPNIPWDGVERRAPGKGYCMHGEEFFATWHRPYVALFEQNLQQHAMKIAKKFKDDKREQYIEEAKKLRSPYWDWARKLAENENALPNALGDYYVTIETPDGEKNVTNPLNHYKFHPIPATGFDGTVYNKIPETLRYPHSSSGPRNAESRENQVAKAMTKERPWLQNQLFRWFSNCPHYFQMNDAAPPKHSDPNRGSKCGLSLESIHGDVHVTFGGFGSGIAGHMTYVPVAGFDPAFWLHHTNVDRLIAMWQQLYPTAYVYKSHISSNTFAYKRGQPIDQDTGLLPFHRNTAGDFWTSRQIRDWRVFQYTYTEFLEGGDSPEGMTKIINELYGAEHDSNQSDKEPQVDQDSNSPATDPLPDGLLSPLIASDHSSFEYLINVVTTKNKLGGSYSIFFFLDEPNSSDPLTWIDDDNLVSSFSVFGGEGMEDSNVVSSNTLSITDALSKKTTSGGLLPNLKQTLVVPFLAKFLKWKVLGPDGTEIDPSKVPDLAITVYSSTLAPLRDLTQFPQWSDFIPLPEVTRGKQGGA